jgi:2,4-dienoyl-CoA reductase-like NADH-dependent reductase (Old Yellow Enzyme family)
MYSAKNGVIGEFHHAHHGAFITGGTGLIVAEATAVTPNGRISTACPGLWDDSQIPEWKKITDFAHTFDVKMAIQLAHAGRKGSTLPPFNGLAIATSTDGGWQTVAPSAIAFQGYPSPRELTVPEIKELVEAWAKAAERAIAAGFDALEIHAAHGYLLHEFYSPLSNERNDEYGGSFENRIRMLLQVVDAVREVMPPSMPLFVRISASDWHEGGWNLDDSIELAKILENHGVDLIDASSGGLVHDQKIQIGPGYQVQFAEGIKHKTHLATSTVGLITECHQANQILSEGKADVIMAARQFLRNPRWPLQAAHDLGVDVAWPNQIARGKI